MIDPTEAVLAFFRSQSGVTSTVTADAQHGIYPADELPFDPDDQSTPPSMVTIQEVPGSIALSSPRIRARFFVRAYAPTLAKATLIYNALWDACRGPGGVARGPTVIPDHGLMRSVVLSRPTVTIEDQGWPVAVGTLDAGFNAYEGA